MLAFCLRGVWLARLKKVLVLHFSEFNTGFPELLGQLVISGLRIPGLEYLTVREVLPSDSLHFFTDSTVDGGLGSLWGCLEEETEWNQQSPLILMERRKGEVERERERERGGEKERERGHREQISDT